MGHDREKLIVPYLSPFNYLKLEVKVLSNPRFNLSFEIR